MCMVPNSQLWKTLDILTFSEGHMKTNDKMEMITKSTKNHWNLMFYLFLKTQPTLKVKHEQDNVIFNTKEYF